LEVKSEPNGAKIWIDLKDVGVTPYKGTVAADEEHDVMISTEGYRFEIRRVTVQPEGKEIVSVILEKLKEGEIGPPTIINPKDGAEMILIPAGEFIMGSDKSKDGMAQDNEQPQRKVYLDGYYIYKYEVTVSQYRKFYQETKRQMMPLAPSWGWQDNHPVVNVTWDDAKAYCDWAGVQLPTEAQWEKAARGTDGRIYPWGNEWDNSKYNNINTGPGQTAPVGSYPQGASPYGVMDLAGNVWEWCADWYDGNYYASAPDRNPQGPASGALRLVRGGSWNVDHYYARAAARIGNDPYVRLNDRGFRCSSPRFPR
jgi:formylglycine-generating enzyme required for sulfatase activity